MNTAKRTAAGAALIALAALLPGCGWFSSDERPANPALAPFQESGRTLARALGTYEIYSADPAAGPLAGGQQVLLDGRFSIPPSTLAILQTQYNVYFGYNLAQYDPAFTPAITANSIYVITPPGDAPGFVDVSLVEIDDMYAAILEDGYEYLDPFDIIAIDPDRGPLAGGQLVTVTGRFPVPGPVLTIEEAYKAYRVYIDGKFAPYNTDVSPIITSEAIYAITPPGDMPGFVDVVVADAQYIDPLFNMPQPGFDFAMRTLPDGYEYVASDITITQVLPDNGFLIGDEPAIVEGMFPIDTDIIDPSVPAMSDHLIAAQFYTVYFGYAVAPFDPMPDPPGPVITQTQLRVRSPRGPDAGPVDVRVVDNFDSTQFAVLEMGYRYYTMLINYIYPISGPTAGGTPVRIDGIFPTAAIYDAYTAYTQYNVFYDNTSFLAGYDTNFSPVITEFPGFQNILTIYDTYTYYNSIYTITPPHPVGIVDVIVADVMYAKEPAATRELLYEYTGEVDNVGDWIDCDIMNNPDFVGPVGPGEIEVRVEVSGTIGNDDEVFIVPQGGDPNIDAHRISLAMDRTDATGANFVWWGRNVDRIETDMFGINTLIPDGHAAVYIEAQLDGDSGTTIIGDDFTPPYRDDGGRIQDAAHEGRHFIIDTSPPRMVLETAPFPSTANAFVSTAPGTSSDTYNANDVIALGGAFPNLYPAMPQIINTGLEIQGESSLDYFWDTNSFIGIGERGAGMFFNKGFVPVAASNFLDGSQTNLTFVVRVLFEDEDIYTVLGDGTDPLPRNLARDTDRFLPAGSPIATDRQVAGFAASLPALTGSFEEILINGADALAIWDTTGSNFGDPEGVQLSATYTGTNDFFGGIPVNEQFDSNLLGSSFTFLEAIWTFVPGIPPESVPLNYQLPTVFRAADRATNYEAIDGTLRKIVTEDERTLPPLTIWWMRDAQVGIDETNIPADEITEAPVLTWTLTSQPRPFTVYRPKPLYSYSIWTESDPTSGTIEERRNGQFVLDSNWTPWNSTDVALPQTVVDGLTPGRWYVVVVSAVDEAGNVASWPDAELPIRTRNPSDDPTNINNLIFVIDEAATSTGDKNWSSFYLEAGDVTVETNATLTHFHEDTSVAPNGRVDPNTDEVNLGSTEIVPLPTNGAALQNTAQVRLEAVIPDDVFPDNINIEWQLESSASTVLSTGTSNVLVNSNRVVIEPLLFPLGDRVTRQPVSYVFRAVTVITVNGIEIRDSTPANVRFTIVDNVAEYIRNRPGQDNQPEKERDRLD